MLRKILSLSTITAALLALPLSSFALTSSELIRFTGTNASDKLGRSVLGADLNGDGFDEVISGAPNNATGYVSITYGGATLPTAKTISTSNSVVITGNGSTDFFGVNLAKGNINGDAYEDLVVTASGDTAGGASNSGAVYIIYGQSANLDSSAVASMSNVAKFYSGPGFLVGSSVAVGDLNNDNFDDVVVGATNDAATGGSAFMIYGQSTNYSGLTNLISGNPKVTGEAAANFFGSAVALGDINSDGYDDLVVGAQQSADGGSASGAIYIFPGQSSAYVGSTSASSVGEYYGEVSNDALGVGIAVGEVTGDGYADIIAAASGNDDEANNAGAIYLIAGSSTIPTATANISTATEWTGSVTSGQLNRLSTVDVDGDSINEIIIGGASVSSSNGAIYIVNGDSASGSLSTVADSIEGTSGESLGSSVGSADVNGDGFAELLAGANTYSSNAGSALIALFLLDSDSDGVAGSGFMLAFEPSTPTDCNDADSTVSANQTYYEDLDGDGLGTTTASTSVCTSTAPTGYADNTDDADDTVVNHPDYFTADPSDKDVAEDSILEVTGGEEGTIIVTYADSTDYTYTILSTTSTKKTLVKQYPNSGYGVVLDRKGKSIKLVNLYNGEVSASKKLNDDSVDSANFLLKDLRNDDATEAIVTTVRNKKTKVFVVKVKKSAGTLKILDQVGVDSNKVDVSKTKVKKSLITLNTSKNRMVAELKANKDYELVLQ